MLWYVTQPQTKIDWAVYIFVARNCRKTTKQNLDAGEKISLDFVDFNQFFNLILEKKISSNIREKFLEGKLDSEKIKEIKKIFFKNDN